MKKEFIAVTLKEAKKAYQKGEVPVGAVIVKNNKIIAKAHNMVEKQKNATLHAEIIAISKATKKLKGWRLNGCEMYVTLEPCEMCRCAIELSRVDKVYFFAKRDKQIKINKEKYKFLKSMESDSLFLIKQFFKSKRG